MKRKIAALLALAVALALETTRVLAEEVTLPELKQQTPERLQMTVTTKAGETVTVDAPIILPEGEELPIIRARPRKMDVEAAWRVYYWPNEDEQFVGEGEEYGYYGYVSGSHWAESEMTVPDKLGGEANAIRVPSLEAPPDNTDLSWEAPQELVLKLLSLMGAGDADVRVAGQVAMSRPYKMEIVRNKKDPEVATTFAAKLDEPIQGRDKGYYDTSYNQYFHGAQVFGESYNLRPYSKYPTPAKKNFYSPTLFIFSRVLSEQDFDVNILLLEETEVLESQVVLASFETVVQTLREQIAAGDLLAVREVELGYQLVWGEPFEALSNDFFEHPSRQTYTLVPCWRVVGYAPKDRFGFRNNRFGDDPQLPTVLDYAYIQAHIAGGTPPLALRVDARTGQVFRGEDFYQGK